MKSGLRLLRVYHDMKIGELAIQLGISQGYLSEIENKKKEPSYKLIKKYAEIFQTKPSVIMALCEKMDKVGFSDKLKMRLTNAIVSVLELAVSDDD